MADILIKSGKENMNVGAFIENEQVGFGRVITDYYTFSWFANFYVLDEHRKKEFQKKCFHIFQNSLGVNA